MHHQDAKKSDTSLAFSHGLGELINLIVCLIIEIRCSNFAVIKNTRLNSLFRMNVHRNPLHYTIKLMN